ncbi:hypothetical protein POM88_026359 [Heracleum sosnowskyi]|uniref:ATPase AAA-type core domain-containing protein n=1 Tax=Heracleum sosnowskyi TaxID=360622 RepID=A0AAD8I8Y9_9APIA|nr:hypothetical protein POM88_026359 [Heracleum sosnowskyi]
MPNTHLSFSTKPKHHSSPTNIILLDQILSIWGFLSISILQSKFQFLEETLWMRSTVSDSGNGDSEVQRTMLELLNQLDGFEALNKIKVLMATNRIDILDQALLRPGRIDRKIEFPNPSKDENHDSSLLPLLERNQPIIRGSNNSGNVIAPSPAELLSAPGVYQNRTELVDADTLYMMPPSRCQRATYSYHLPWRLLLRLPRMIVQEGLTIWS